MASAAKMSRILPTLILTRTCSQKCRGLHVEAQVLVQHVLHVPSLVPAPRFQHGPQPRRVLVRDDVRGVIDHLPEQIATRTRIRAPR